MISKTLLPSGMAVIRSTAGRLVVGPSVPRPVPEVFVLQDADESQYSEAPRTISKMKVVAALAQADAWPQVKAWLEASGLYDLFLAANVLEEGEDYFSQGVAALKSELGYTDEQVEALLEACVADQ